VRIGNPKNQYNLLPRPSDLPSDQTQVNYLNVIAKSFSPEEKKVVVNAIDIDTYKLAASWLLIVTSQIPAASRRERFVVKFKKDSSANFVAQVHFKNTAKMRKLYFAKFSLASDKPHLMVPRN